MIKYDHPVVLGHGLKIGFPILIKHDETIISQLIKKRWVKQIPVLLEYVAQNIETYPMTDRDIVSLLASRNENMKTIYSNIFVTPNWLG